MRIGVDVDGVLTDIERYLWDYGSKYATQNKLDTSIDHTQYNTIDMFAWEKELDGSFWKDIFEHYCTKAPIRTFASEILKKLKKEGHEIYIITARCPEEDATEKNIKKSNNMLKKWLKSNKVKYDKLIFTGCDKSQQIKDNAIDIMIEDCPANIKQLSKEIPMICFHSSYNEKLRGKNIVRCHTWYEVYNRINSLEMSIE
jgi:uncharacterized HAD superfamily protein